MDDEGFTPVKSDTDDLEAQYRPIWGAHYVVIVHGEMPRYGHTRYFETSSIDQIDKFYEYDFKPKLIIEVGLWDAALTLFVPDPVHLAPEEDFDPVKHSINRTVEKLVISQKPQLIKSSGSLHCPEAGEPEWTVEFGSPVNIATIKETELGKILEELDKEVYAYLPPAQQETLRSCLLQMGVDIPPLGQGRPDRDTPAHIIERSASKAP